MIAAELVGIDVDLDELLVLAEAGHRHATGHHEHHVGRAHVTPQRTLGRERGAEREIAGVADRALALGALNDAGLEIVGDRGEGLVSARGMDAAARVDQRALGGEQHRGRALQIGPRRDHALVLRRIEERDLALVLHRLR